jgi:alkanesulfonate monooxygenase
LEENLQIAKHMWAENLAPYEGKHYHLAEPMNHPQPISKPHPPILIGGGGEKKTLRMVAQYGDACNLFGMLGQEEIARKLDILKQHCEDVGRDYNEIDRTVIFPAAMHSDTIDAASLVESCRMLAGLGVQHVIFTGVPRIHEITSVQQIGRQVIPEVATL